jgi:hypothetical protein
VGWRLRRVFRTGPFNWILSKSGIGWSVGVPGLRYGINAIGRRYVSIGIPGTGIYWIKYLTVRSSPSLSSSPQPQQPPFPPGPSPQIPSAAGSPSSVANPPTATQRPWWMAAAAKRGAGKQE